MWRGELWAAACLLAGIAGSTSAQAPPATGCVGAPVDSCIAQLRASMKLEEGLLAGSLAERHHVDVNGRPLGGIVTIIARLPGSTTPVNVILNLSSGDRVGAAAGTLLRDPRAARTEADYAATGLYDIALRLGGERCPDRTPLALYRFFENTVKPRIRVSREDVRGAYSGGHREIAAAERVPYCGIHLTYIGLRQWSGPDDPAFASRASETDTIRFEP
jgi:hypothetical protein